MEGETLSQLLYRLEGNQPNNKGQITTKPLPEWFAAIGSLEHLLLSTLSLSSNEKKEGLVLSAPTSVISSQTLLNQLQIGILASKRSTHSLPACLESQPTELPDSILELPLNSCAPLSREPFCLVVTSKFSLVLVWGEGGFQFSFKPEIVEQVWLRLKRYLLFIQSEHLTTLEQLVEELGFRVPEYQIVVNFSRQLLQYLPNFTPVPPKTVVTVSHNKDTANTTDFDVQLLQALTHEVRTPLTTIRTLTQLLLKRVKPGPEISKHLEIIEQECTAQINRMELIFRAAELKTTTSPQHALQLVPISLEQVLQESIPRWQQQAQRRKVSLEVSLPHKLPSVVSDPAVLKQMLTNLIEQFTRNLPEGGQIQVQVSTAGNQLKLRFQTNSATQNSFFKSIGKLLIFQPDTGNLTLNPHVTKNLFRSLGCRLTVRQRQGRSEVLTVFLPLRGSPEFLV